MKKIYLTVLLALVLASSSCGVPSDRSPRAIPADNVPFELLTPPTTPSPAQAPVETEVATIYLVGESKLVAATRTVAAPLSLGSVLALLTQGATAEETTAGLRSAINPQTTVLNTQVTNGTAVLNISDAFSKVSLREQIIALAQLVYTASGLANVDNVQVSLNSSPVEVPRGDGTLTREPLRTSDYSEWAPVVDSAKTGKD